MDVELEKLLKEKKQKLTRWVNFKDLFDLEIAYVEPAELDKARAKCMTTKWKKHQPVEKVDEGLFAGYLASKIINWSGLTLDVAAQLMPIDINGEDPGNIVPPTTMNKRALVENSYGLATFLLDNIVYLQAFREEQFEEEKKTSEVFPDSGSVTSDATPAGSATDSSETG